MKQNVMQDMINMQKKQCKMVFNRAVEIQFYLYILQKIVDKQLKVGYNGGKGRDKL